MRSGSKISAVAIAAVLLLTGCNNGIPTPESENVTRVADSTVVEAATTNADDLSVAASITTSDSSVTDNTDIFEEITDTSMPDPGIGPMYGTSPDKDRIYTYATDISEPLGDDAFRIFEEFFYGEWECISKYENSAPTFDMTYNGSSFRFGRILGIFETDEIYVLHYNSGGGTLECYVIEKSAPETMYSTDVLPSLGGIEEIKLGNDEPMKFINRKPAAAELKTGELSIPGLTYLFHIYGSDFEDYYREIIDRDGYRSISEDEELYLGNGYVLDNFTQYLVDMSEDNVTVALPYVHDKQEAHQTAVYYELTFTKDANGEWSVEYAKSETYTTVYSFNGVEIPDELITEDGENYIRASAAFIVSPVDGILSIVKHNDKYGNIVIRSCSSTLFKNEDNIPEFGEQSAVVSEEVEVSGNLYIDRQNIDETYGRNGGIEFVPDGDTLPLFLSERSREDNTGNPLFIGSIFESSPYYIGDEFADFMKNYNGGQVTVRLNNIRIALTAYETDNSKATLMAIEGM